MNSSICKKLSFAECELAILRTAVDKAEEKIGKRIVSSEEIQKIIHIVETFIRRKKLICYGGTAINNILPEDDQFYNKESEIPDYDFFSPHALEDAKELADIYLKDGFSQIEAKSGQHHGTYKVYVNYIPIADITFIHSEIFSALKKDAIQVNGIMYTPPNFLRMSMYLELSRPAGDTSRWEKVMKRLILLNKYYPITDINCHKVKTFQRTMVYQREKEAEIYETVRSTFVHQGVVFFGGYAISLYSKYMPKPLQYSLKKYADFEVLSNDPLTTAEITKERLNDIGVKNVKIVEKAPIGEIIPMRYELMVGKDSVAFIYKPIACHSYNVISIHNEKVKIATIDIMLSFYLAFLYTNQPYYNEFLNRILCMSKFLFDVQQHNRLSQKGLLQRFSILCYGHQETLEEMRAEKAKKFNELKRNTKEFEEWFLNYKPVNKNQAETSDNKEKDKEKEDKEKEDKEKDIKSKTFKKHRHNKHKTFHRYKTFHRHKTFKFNTFKKKHKKSKSNTWTIYG